MTNWKEKNHKTFFEAVDKLSEKDYNVVAEAYTELETEHDRCVETIQRLTRDLKDCKNELCLKCGAYRDGGLIACEHCRWYQ